MSSPSYIPPHIVTDVDTLVKYRDGLLSRPAFAFDIETVPPDSSIPYGKDGGGDYRAHPSVNRVSWISFASNGTAFCVPVGHPVGDNLLSGSTRLFKGTVSAQYDDPPAQLDPYKVFEVMEPLFFNEGIRKIAHGSTFDIPSLAKYYDNRIILGPYSDTIVHQWILNENIQDKEDFSGPKRPLNYKLKTLVDWYFDHHYDAEGVGERVECYPFSKIASYSVYDAMYTWQLFKLLDPQIDQQNLRGILQLEEDLMPCLYQMRLNGAPLHVPRLESFYKDLEEQIDDIEGQAYKEVGRKFLITSGPQKIKILFEERGLTPKKRTKTGRPAIDAETLQSFPDDELCKILLRHNKLTKFFGTYVRSYLGDGKDYTPMMIRHDDDQFWVHTDLVQYGTVTGRFSSREPNLQNCPNAKSEMGKRIRSCFNAPPGYKLVVADYSQMEPRVMASYIGHGTLYDAFQSGQDPYIAQAQKVFDKQDISSTERGASKTLLLAVMYGTGEYKVANMLGIPLHEAKEILARDRRTSPEVYDFRENVLATARKRRPPHLFTLMGRKRTLWALNHPVTGKRERAERQAFNALIQGSLGDVIKLAMTKLHELFLPYPQFQILLSVHDELVCIAPENEAEHCAQLLKEAMTGPHIANLFRVPIEAEPTIAQSWDEAKD